MAAFVCSRKKFQETRAASPDALAIEHTKRILGRIESFRVPIEGTRRVLPLRISNGWAKSPSIQVMVEKYGPESLTGMLVRCALLKEVGDDYGYAWHPGSQYMLVTPLDADTLDSLMGRQFLLNPKRNIGFANAMDRFVMCYSQGPDSLPLVSPLAPVLSVMRVSAKKSRGDS